MTGKIRVGIVFAIALIIGLALGFLCGAATSLYIGASFVEEIIETNGITIVFDVNETALGDYAFKMMEGEIDKKAEELIIEFADSKI